MLEAARAGFLGIIGLEVDGSSKPLGINVRYQENTAKVSAYQGWIEAAGYTLDFYDDGVVLSSLRVWGLWKGRGISRPLIAKATEIIQEQATKLGQPFTHKAQIRIENKTALERLPHILEEFGYQDGGLDEEEPYFRIWSRTYTP